jgi:hypothetical protein
MGVRLDWRGDEVRREVERRMAQAMGRFGLNAEGEAKRQLWKGHGVITGTLRRSIHTAQPGYNWGGDSGETEMGGKAVDAAVHGERIVVELGSGLRYALAVHQGHHGFSGYHYLVNGVERAKAQLAAILREFRL